MPGNEAKSVLSVYKISYSIMVIQIDLIVNSFSTSTKISIIIIIICLTHAWESMGKPRSCAQFIKIHILYYKSQESVSVLQVTRESVSALQVTYVRIHIGYYKNMQWNLRFM